MAIPAGSSTLPQTKAPVRLALQTRPSRMAYAVSLALFPGAVWTFPAYAGSPVAPGTVWTNVNITVGGANKSVSTVGSNQTIYTDSGKSIIYVDKGDISKDASVYIDQNGSKAGGVSLVRVRTPGMSQWLGLALVFAVGVAAAFVLSAAWPRKNESGAEARRAADAAAASNVAWAVTARDGAVLDCNVAYRFLAGSGEGEPPAREGR